MISLACRKHKNRQKENWGFIGSEKKFAVSVCKNIMELEPEFLASSWGREFVAGGFGGIAGIVSGFPLDTLRIRQQQSNAGSAFSILRNVMATEGPAALYRGMGAPLASVTLQVFPFLVDLLV